MRTAPEKISSDPPVLQLRGGVLPVQRSDKPVELGQVAIAHRRRLNLLASSGGRDATFVDANLAHPALVALVDQPLEELGAVPACGGLLERRDGEFVIRDFAAERLDHLDGVVDRLHPLLALDFGFHVKREGRFLRLPRQQQLVLEARVAPEGLPRVTHLDEVVGEVVRFPKRVLALADASVGVLHQNHNLLEDERVAVLVLLVLVRFDVQVAVEQQPAVLRQFVAIRKVQINYRLANLLDDIQLLAIALHFVDELCYVHHRFLRALQAAEVVVRRLRLVHELVEQQVVL